MLFCTLTGEQRTLYKGYLSSKELQVGGGLNTEGKRDELRLTTPAPACVCCPPQPQPCSPPPQPPSVCACQQLQEIFAGSRTALAGIDILRKVGGRFICALAAD